MKLQKKLEKAIRSASFKLLYNEEKHSYQEVVSSFIKKTEEVVGLKFVGLYAYCDWCKKYNLIVSSDNQKFTYANFLNEISHKTPNFSNYEFNNGVLNGDLIFERHPNQMDSCILKLNPYKEKVIYILVLSDQSLSLTKELINMLKQEITQFLYIIERYYDETALNKKNAFLLDMTSKFNTSMNDGSILKMISDSLHDLYPDFKHHILLSHDHDSDDTLPIMLMDYSDSVTQQMSTKAFTTGEIQIERGLEDDYAYIYSPLSGNQGVYGVIQITLPIEKYFPEKEVTFLKRFSMIAGRAMESTLLYQNASLMIADLKLLNKAVHEFNSNLKLIELISIITSKIKDICAPMEIGFVFVNEEDVTKHSISEGSTSFFRTQEGDLFTESLVKKMAENIESVFSGDYTEVSQLTIYKSIMSIPMTHSKRYFGFIVIMHEKEAYFSFDNFKLIQSLVHHSTLAFSNTLLKVKLETLSITDYLTKLHSRRYLDEELKRHMEIDDEGTMILFDVDDFKKVNDTYGHAVGDEVLIQIGAIIKENIEDNDIAARWGGEEFAIFLPNKNLTKGIELAEVLKQEVKKKTHPSVSFSCGVTTWNDNQTNSIQTIFSRADKALYLAKNSGKNCIKAEKSIS